MDAVRRAMIQTGYEEPGRPIWIDGSLAAEEELACGKCGAVSELYLFDECLFCPRCFEEEQ